MKKIAILTFCTSPDNYGQILQSYALQRYLRNHFHQYEVKLLHLDPFAKPCKPKKKKLVKKIYEKCKSIERVIRTYFHAYIMRRQKYIQRLKSKPNIEIKSSQKDLKLLQWNEKRAFERFRQRHISLHGKKLEIFSGYKNEYDADFYIVGSDQVFNCWGAFKNSKHYLDFFTLEFLPPHHKSKKLSYAASFGKREFANEEESAYFQKSLKKFDALSVREVHNVKNLQDLGLKSLVVPDPSVLLTKAEYEKLIDAENKTIDLMKSDDKIRKNSLFVYMLGNETSIDKDEVMAFLQKDNEIIYTNANVDFSCGNDLQNDFAPSVQEWLVCVKECKGLVTNSFHGVSYAILMNTPFVALKLGGGASMMNTRFEWILELLNLQNRLVDNIKDLQKQMNEPINWDFVNERLKAWREVGAKFLQENLK